MSCLSLCKMNATHYHCSLAAGGSWHFVLHVLKIYLWIRLNQTLITFDVLPNLIAISHLLFLIKISIIISHVLFFWWVFLFVFQIILTTVLRSFFANWSQILPWISVVPAILGFPLIFIRKPTIFKRSTKAFNETLGIWVNKVH